MVNFKYIAKKCLVFSLVGLLVLPSATVPVAFADETLSEVDVSDSDIIDEDDGSIGNDGISTNDSSIDGIDTDDMGMDDLDVEDNSTEDKDIEDKDIGDKDIEDKDTEDKDIKDKDIEDKNTEDKDIEDKDIEDKDIGDKDIEDKDTEDKDIKDKDIEDKDIGDKDTGDKDTEDNDANGKDLDDKDDTENPDEKEELEKPGDIISDIKKEDIKFKSSISMGKVDSNVTLKNYSNEESRAYAIQNIGTIDALLGAKIVLELDSEYKDDVYVDVLINNKMTNNNHYTIKGQDAEVMDGKCVFYLKSIPLKSDEVVSYFITLHSDITDIVFDIEGGFYARLAVVETGTSKDIFAIDDSIIKVSNMLSD